MSSNTHTAYFTYEGTEPEPLTLSTILNKAGYQNIQEQQLLTWTVYSDQSGSEIESNIGTVIGSGFTYTSSGGTGTIVGCDVDRAKTA